MEKIENIFDRLRVKFKANVEYNLWKFSVNP